MNDWATVFAESWIGEEKQIPAQYISSIVGLARHAFVRDKFREVTFSEKTRKQLVAELAAAIRKAAPK